MANHATKVIYRGISFPTTLFFVFLILKLTEAIDWSWWWIFAPLWIPWAVLFGLLSIVLVGVLIFLGISLILEITK